MSREGVVVHLLQAVVQVDHGLVGEHRKVPAEKLGGTLPLRLIAPTDGKSR